VADLDRAYLRKLAEWDPAEVPVTSVYLSVDGRRYPRKHEYEVQLEDLLHTVKEEAARLEPPQRTSVESDAGDISRFVKEEFDRGSNRGLALFSAHGAGLWETVVLSRPVRNRAVVAPHPDLLQLEALLEIYESFCTVLVDSEKARVFLAELGRIEEQSELLDDVPGRHDQGGRSQARYQRHVDDHRRRHLKHTADVLFGFFKRREFDHLILGGPEEIVAEFEHELHDYLRQRVRARVSLAITASTDEVLQRSLELEEHLERERERAAVEQVVADVGAGRPAAAGLGPTLAALRDERVGTLVVAFDFSAPGRECPNCGALFESGTRCQFCGAETRKVGDVVESAVAAAFRQGARVETVTEDGSLEELGGIGALLRF
jgi:peptide chain release factor subunit 1